MKKLKKYILIGLGIFTLNSCNNWLTVYPENEQVSDQYWTSKEDVESVMASGYYYLRAAVPNLIQWGELRAGSIYSSSANHLQSFQVVPTDKAYANWGPLYQVINMANAVLQHIDDVAEVDETFVIGAVNAYKSEACFLRALSYFYIVRNWGEAPLLLESYETDELSFNMPKSSEADLIKQIKADINYALSTGSAPEYYETEWETKGRGTSWAMYALLADVCLWSEDYAGALAACNAILDATTENRPKFLDPTETTNAQWFDIFNPGNCIESIFEVQWDYNASNSQTNNFANTLFGITNPTYQYSSSMLKAFIQETTNAGGVISCVRSMYGGCYVSNMDYFEDAKIGYVWKYSGTGEKTSTIRPSTEYDPHFIIYRVSDIKLMKAEALIRLGSENYEAAIAEVNDIRKRANLNDLFIQNADEITMLQYVLAERNIEFAAEGKRWYDLLRFGRSNNFKYRNEFISLVTNYNQTANPTWIRSVLRNDNALFMPVWQTELENNTLLTQNPYYE